jgi:hypothetical protein
MLSGVVLVYGCTKTQNQSGSSSSSLTLDAYAQFSTDQTKSPYYGDTVLYIQGSSASNYLFRPVKDLGAGTYVSWPTGLFIDKETGVIDASQSEQGARYNVGFVKAGTRDTVFSQVILAGITYADGVYMMNTTDSLLHPTYISNAVSSGRFDEFSPMGSTASNEHLMVATTDGSINLTNSLRQGLFGASPENGATKLITIYYRLNDQSQMALQKSSVLVHYYETLEDVPADLLALCQMGRSAMPEIAMQTEKGGVETNAVSTPPKGGTTTTTTAKPAAAPAPAPVAPRPPQIVIVNTGHH